MDQQQTCTTVRWGETCVVWVDFRPSNAGEKHAHLIVRTGDGNEFRSEFKGLAKGNIAKPVPPPPDLSIVTPPVHSSDGPRRSHDPVTKTDGPQLTSSTP